ncbi:MAG: hypothetical protein ACYDHP_06185 [Ferrimicrobium sp.]
MGIRNHIGIKLSALALTGGTAAMLFGATPVQTQFSATSNGSFSASGATVAETPAYVTYVATGLLPNNVPTNPETFSMMNAGTVPEDFVLTINSVTSSDVSWASLAQLEFVVTNSDLNGGSPVTMTMNPYASNCGNNTSASAIDILPLSDCNTPLTAAEVIGLTLPVGTDVPVGGTYGSANATLQMALAPTPTGTGAPGAGQGWGANDWNGKGATINYTITATPTVTAASLPGANTPGGPTLTAS